MSLLQSLPFKEYQKAKLLSLEQCEMVARFANLEISFKSTENPGELLLKALDRRGYNIKQYSYFLTPLLRFKPKSKIAILIANDRYIHLCKLATPSTDCDSLGVSLKNLGFIVVNIRNTSGQELKVLLNRICDLVPEDSYCFVFYAGHGCQICNTKCMLSVDCPTENIEITHCITENYLLKELEKCKLELCVLIMDMCRVPLDRETNPKIYESMMSVEDYVIYKNLVIGYATQSSQSAYEVLQIECSTTIATDVTYQLRTRDLDKIVPEASQYVNALCVRLEDGLDVNRMLDKVHADVEKSIKKQRPIKLQCGADTRYLNDPVIDDTSELFNKLKEATKEFKERCILY
ncbi:hypothetical protein K1T71_012567 [Dendrolimus kikuchii]|uniref:Uncharacterized protein n=1 Tax=Dendrolimus kikuchii TaxID=765133 RepID=A0ACC1CK58_9NEOP|nr:hypothetical protein K1T71_012567 [Dendrolimus kikuchii]